MDNNILGTCSECGGAVVTPRVWSSIVPPIPRCRDCGATARQSYGPVIDMKRAEPDFTILPVGKPPLRRIKFFCASMIALLLAVPGCTREGCGRDPDPGDPEPANCKPGQDCPVKDPKPEDPKKLETGSKK